jgi:hypothetical protein
MAVVEWPEITTFDFAKVKSNKTQFFIDCRNQFQANMIKSLNYQYIGIGKS